MSRIRHYINPIPEHIAAEIIAAIEQMSRSNRQPEQQREPITNRNQKIGFGRYAKETVQDILDNDSQYLVWIHENTDFELGHELLEEAINNGKPNHEFKGWTERSR